MYNRLPPSILVPISGVAPYACSSWSWLVRLSRLCDVGALRAIVSIMRALNATRPHHRRTSSACDTATDCMRCTITATASCDETARTQRSAAAPRIIAGRAVEGLASTLAARSIRHACAMLFMHFSHVLAAAPTTHTSPRDTSLDEQTCAHPYRSLEQHSAAFTIPPCECVRRDGVGGQLRCTTINLPTMNEEGRERNGLSGDPAGLYFVTLTQPRRLWCLLCRREVTRGRLCNRRWGSVAAHAWV